MKLFVATGTFCPHKLFPFVKRGKKYVNMMKIPFMSLLSVLALTDKVIFLPQFWSHQPLTVIANVREAKALNFPTPLPSHFPFGN